MKRVLLTGAGGAIGIHFIAHFMHNTDWFLVCTDSFKTEHKGFFDRIIRVCRNHPDWPARIKIIQHDLRTPFSTRQIEEIGHVDYIINLAARSDVGASVEKEKNVPTGVSAEFIRNNTELMLNMVDYARIVQPEVFLQFSTDEVYGPAPKDSKGHKEWSPILPSNPYSVSKAIQEAIAIGNWRSYDLPLIITNTMNNFGEMQAPSKFPAMIQKKIEAGEVVPVHASKSGEIGTRYYLHSRNAADAVLFILRNVKPVLHSAGEIDRPVRLNIVGDKQISNIELPEIIARLMGKPVTTEKVFFHDDNPGHDLHYGLDGSLLASLGWKSPIDFETSMKNTIEWQQRNPEWMK
jgi:dTDP-glucose 4,6-dehydratase